MTEITGNIKRIRERVKLAEKQFSRKQDSVTILVVSKNCTVESIAEAIACGCVCFAESYLQEAELKIAALANRSEKLEWHFIGPIQSNKTKSIAEKFDWVHSVDRLKIAQRLNEQRPATLAPLNICIQVNISSESAKSGTTLEELTSLVESFKDFPRLKLRGLMVIPVRSHDFEQQRQSFQAVQTIFNDLNSSGYALDTLSMGMSGDLEAAIAEGATHVRIGRAIFGERT